MPARLVLLSLCVAQAKKSPPVAVEARFKERITLKLEAALASATAHLAWALGVTSESSEDVFAPHYELDLRTGSTWRAKCEADIDTERDSVAHCVIHKLQALSALCEAPGVAEAHRPGILRLLKQLLVKRETVIPGLGVKRSMLPIGNGMEVWMSETSVGSGNFDVMVPLHAAATLAVVQCGSALSEPKFFETAQAWFASIEKAWPQRAWAQASFHMNSILWESFVRISTMIRSDSSCAEELQDFNRGFEAYLQAKFSENPQSWSFSGAHATVLTWQREKKKARRKKLAASIIEYTRRWRQLAPALNVTTSYTCGPLQGVAPLLLKPGEEAAELVSSLLKLAEKDVDLFQLSFAQSGDSDAASTDPSPAAARVGEKLLKKLGGELNGAFVRDEGQWKGEKRRSIRIDDTAQCVVGITRTLQLLETLVGVEVPTPGAEGAAAEEGAAAGGADEASGAAPTEEL